MSSFVFYKFKSQKEPSRILFDGTGISVWDLKKEIIMENKMGKGADFDFAIYNADTEEEYTDDHTIVPRSTSVLAQRLPPMKAGRGNAQFYMAAALGAIPSGNERNGVALGSQSAWRDKGSMSKRFDGREDVKPVIQNQEPTQVVAPAAASGDEASAMAAMFAATSQQWQQTQQQMAAATPIYRAPLARAPRPAAAPRPPLVAGSIAKNASGSPADQLSSNSSFQSVNTAAQCQHKATPAGYICYRCGQKGHWIQDCPTNGDKAWDDKPKIKRTTGIPKSFLTEVEGPGLEGVAGMMVTSEGGFVIAKPDAASWNSHLATTKNLSANDIQNLAPTDPDLTCPICSKLLRDAVLTPCCSISFCQECVHNFLNESDFLCPECESRIKNLDKLKVDEERRGRVKVYIDEMVEASKEVVVVEEASESVEAKVEEGVAVVKVEDGVKVEGGAALDSKTVHKVDDTVITTETESLITQSKSQAPPSITAVVKSESVDSFHEASPAPSTIVMDPAFLLQQEQQRAVLYQQQQQQLEQQMAIQIQMQQQQLHQQQLLQQQQQQQQQFGYSPQMLQQQIYQLNMTLSNPQLHPQMRMQFGMQLQQLQMMAAQQQQQLQQLQHQQRQMMGGHHHHGAHSQMRAAVSAAYGGNFAPGRAGAIVANGTKSSSSIPTGPRAASPTDTAGIKRGRAEEPEVEGVKVPKIE